MIARPVEIHRQQENRIQAILLPVCLALNQQRLLGNAIRCGHFFRISVPQVFLTKGDRGELRVRADGAEYNYLFDSVPASSLDEFDPHDGVRVKEKTRIPLVGPDSPYCSRGMN